MGFGANSTNAGSNGTLNEFEGMGGNDTIIGNGATRLSYVNATAAVTVDIAAGTATGDASVGTDTFSGVNSIRGSQFDDTLRGGTGTDFLEGGYGNDLLDGRGGIDTAVYNLDTSVTSGITVHLAAGTVTGDATVGTDTLRSIEGIRGTNFGDVYDATGFSGTSTNAGSSGAFNVFEGMGGNDTIIGNGATELTFAFATSGVTVNMAAGTVDGDASVGHDTFTGVNQIFGSAFNDTITGSAATDILSGGAGNDRITGGAGNDILNGGAGNDTFVFGPGNGLDLVQDFAPGTDTIEIQGAAAGFDPLAHATQSGANTVITIDAQDTITLQNVQVANLHASDFHVV